MSFANLKQNAGNALAKLQQQVKDSESGSGNRDPRVWKMSYNKDTKIGSAVIRFLPFDPKGEGRMPWGEWIEYSFKSKGGSYWERSLKSIGQDDPVAELNHQQWERNQGDDRDQVKKRGRRLRYVSNIVVINDPAHPENNGKNFLFEYGPAIHTKIVKAMIPDYDDVAPVNVFDLWEGANFKLRTKDKAGFVNYDDSEFDTKSPLHQDDSVLETIYNGMHDFSDLESHDKYKTYQELEKQMIKVLGARVVSSIRGEEYNPQMDAQAGGNPFPEAGQGGQPQQPNNPFGGQQNGQQANNPFGGQQNGQQANNPFGDQQPQQGTDNPFGEQQAPVNSNPFGDQPQQSTGNPFENQGQSNDPFGGQSQPQANDPFADLNV